MVRSLAYRISTKVLGLAALPLSDADFNALKAQGNAGERFEWFKQKKDAAFLGLLANQDPPRPGVSDIKLKDTILYFTPNFPTK